MGFLQLAVTPSDIKRLKGIILSSLFVLGALTAAQANEWIPVTGAEALKNYMSGMKVERTLPNGTLSRGEYNADGTGIVSAWGATIPRTWTIKGEDQLCVTAEQVTSCYQIERNSDNEALYRARDVVSGTVVEFQVADGKTIVSGEPEDIGNKGGASTPSAAELAAELANPNTAVATMTFKNQFRWFEGDLPDADDQFSYTLLFQPALPFVLPSEDKIFWRPAVPILVDQPMFDPVTAGFGVKTGLGDIVFDLAYAPKLEDKSLLVAFGFITSLPTATNDLGSGQWTLGPELLIGKMAPKLNYYVEKADAFGPEWMLSVNIAPVVKNGLASLFGL